jgi:hypothetical protein
VGRHCQFKLASNGSVDTEKASLLSLDQHSHRHCPRSTWTDQAAANLLVCPQPGDGEIIASCSAAGPNAADDGLFGFDRIDNTHFTRPYWTRNP